ncbi:uncharacterized protein RSE6_02232 [Rhynchosporium secalis]|uniref:Uncharacterized protein n=1 Tax=Rhynchosporium secalis TaxID=38038 RepID=A0A1E1LZS1_RHYSE|nr:uncharacterized protein RSE6_02232 [Rhynchosporium secalis]
MAFSQYLPGNICLYSSTPTRKIARISNVCPIDESITQAEVIIYICGTNSICMQTTPHRIPRKAVMGGAELSSVHACHWPYCTNRRYPKLLYCELPKLLCSQRIFEQ